MVNGISIDGEVFQEMGLWRHLERWAVDVREDDEVDKVIEGGDCVEEVFSLSRDEYGLKQSSVCEC